MCNNQNQMGAKVVTFSEKLEAFKGHDLSCLTKRQAEVVELGLSGKSVTEIAKILNCSKQNVHTIISSARLAISRKPSLPREHAVVHKSNSRKPNSHKCVHDFSLFPRSEIDSLPAACREVVVYRLQNKTYREIAEIRECSMQTVAALLSRAYAKLSGTYDASRANKMQALYRQKQDNEKSKEYAREYYQKHKQELAARQKEYNKKYYQQHRDVLLKRQKDRSAAKKQGPQA